MCLTSKCNVNLVGSRTNILIVTSFQKYRSYTMTITISMQHARFLIRQHHKKKEKIICDTTPSENNSMSFV